MESEKYREFLKRQAGNRPLPRNISTEKMIFSVPKQSIEEPARDESSDILDSIFLGKEMSQSVTVDRKAASLLRYRIDALEEENLQMRRKVRLMKMILIFMAAVIFSLCVYLVLYLI